MSKTRSTSATVVVAWWLDAGDEECPHCGQLYIYEREIRCGDCDSPICPHCKQLHVEGHHVCPDCVEPSVARNPPNG